MKISNEAKIGIFVVAVAIIALVMTVKAGDIKWKREGYYVKIQFHQIDGVSTNTPVMLNGFEIGAVKKIVIKEMPEGTIMELNAFLDSKVKLREGTEAYVKSLGFLGEKYVGLNAGPGTMPYLTPGAIIAGKEPMDMSDLLVEGQGILANVNERLKKNQDNIDRILKNLASITDNLDDRLAINKDHIDHIMANVDDISVNLKSASANLDQFSADLKVNPWKLMYRPKRER